MKDHLANPAPPLIAQAIDAWLRVGRGRPLELADAVLLHIPDGEQFQAIATSRRLRPFLLGCPGPGWLVVKKETRKELAAVLEGLGFTVIRELIHDEFAADGKAGKTIAVLVEDVSGGRVGNEDSGLEVRSDLKTLDGPAGFAEAEGDSKAIRI